MEWKAKEITARILNEGEVDDARRFLYTVYCEELKWNFPADNPSRLRGGTHGGHRMLIDDFDEVSEWHGAFFGNELVGLGRRAGRGTDGRLEIERYVRLPAEIAKLPELVELSRGAISPKFRGKGGCVMLHLILSSARSCALRSESFIAAPSNDKMLELWKKADALITDFVFKYDKSDPAECRLAAADNRHVHEVIRRVEALLAENA